MNNPLLSFAELPRFDEITPEHVAPAIDALLADANAALETVTAPDFPAQWSAIARVLDVAIEKLGCAWGVVSHLNGVADTPELRAAYNAALPRVTEFFTRLGADERLYAKYKAIDPVTLNLEQLQAHKNAVRNFVLGGAELVGAARERFAAIQERQAELSQKFSENALDATDAFAYYADEAELAGVPLDVQQTALAAAQALGKPGYQLTLKMPCYLPVMQFAHSSALRERLYRAYVTRASDQAPSETLQYDNSALIAEMLTLRLEEAKLLREKIDARLAANPKANIVVLGDFNDGKDSPSTKVIIGRGKHKLVDTRPAERNGDNVPNSNPAWEPRNITWTHYYGKEDVLTRIDFILISEGLAREWIKEETYIPFIPNWGVGSDHRPIMATFEAADRPF